MSLRKVKGRGISVLIGSDIWQKEGLFPPLVFLLYSHQVQMIYMEFRSFSPRILNAFYHKIFKNDWLIFYWKLLIGPQPRLIYNSFQNNGLNLRMSFHCSHLYFSHLVSTPLILISKMPSCLVLPCQQVIQFPTHFTSII